MKIKFLSLLIVLLTIMLAGCGSSTEPTTQKTSVSGVVQKGPFLQGSIAKIFKLDSQYERTSTMMQTTVSDDVGSYSFPDISWSGLSEIEVTGRFLDENTGDDSKSATVTSIVMVQADGSVNTNVNILTHMASGQIKKLLKEGKTLGEAKSEVVGEVFGILGRTNLGINDFGDLDLADLLGSKATANSELLFLSAALLKSDNYMQDLEALLALYKAGGIDAILGSDIYARLMRERQELDETTIVRHVDDDASEVQIAQIQISPMVQVTRVLNSDMLHIHLYGTKFASKTPNIALAVEGGSVTKGDVTVSDNNSSATVAISGDIGGCKNVYVVVTIDYNELIDAAVPIRSNRLNLHPSNVICAPREDNDDTMTPVLPTNKAPVAIIGMIDDAVHGQQATKTLTAQVNVPIGGDELASRYSYDQDAYPNGGIVKCEWKDENNVLIKSANNADCDIYNKVFDTAGDYIYTLTVTDNRDATNSNTITIHVVEPNPQDASPVAKIDEVNTTVNQEIYAGNAPYAMAGGSDDHGIVYCKWQDMSGALLYEKSISPSQTTLDYNTCNYNFPIIKSAGNYIYTLTVRDTSGQEDTNELNVTVLTNSAPVVNIGEDKSIAVGTTLDLTATATDADDDDMTYLWMYGEKKEHATISGAGTNLNFSHQFSEVGIYSVSFEARDTHGATTVAEIDINVTQASQDLTNIVVIGDLMWEDTVHTRTGKVANWSAAQTYCNDLVLGGFSDWKLANTDELSGIMDSNDTTTKAIIDGFVQFDSQAGVGSWTNVKNVDEHIVGWFTGSNWNFDGLRDTNSEQGVRCVRDIP